MSREDPWTQRPSVNRQITLASRPVGAPRKADFKLVESPLPVAGDGELLCRTIHLSIDPYMRGRMNDSPSYAEAIQLGNVMVGESISVVMQSSSELFPVGSYIRAAGGWQDYFTCRIEDAVPILHPDDVNAESLQKLSMYLGMLGMPGLTAYVGLLDIGKPVAAETVVVSAATGAVGSVVGQLAKLQGCRVVGIAGSGRKCEYAINTLGLDDCVNHHSDRFTHDLAAACPDGVDVYFESVGGKVFEALLPLLNIGARIPLCGGIAYYNLTALPKGGDKIPILMRTLLVKRILVQGFIITDHEHRRDDFSRDMLNWLDAGKLEFKEDFSDGLAHAPAALFDILAGNNFGKKIVRVGRPDADSPVSP